MCCSCSISVDNAVRELYRALTIEQVQAIENFVAAKLEYARCDGSMDD